MGNFLQQAADEMNSQQLQNAAEANKLVKQMQQQQREQQQQQLKQMLDKITSVPGAALPAGASIFTKYTQQFNMAVSISNNTTMTGIPQVKFKNGSKVTHKDYGPRVFFVQYADWDSRRYIYTLKDEDGDIIRCLEDELKVFRTKPVTKVTFNSVIMADDMRQQILEALEQINQFELIFETWGFGATIEKGRGVSMLFYGPPGTGKTLVSQAVATQLGKKLLVVGTADIESSAPGEAERNIRKHFAEAQKKDAILLFDECDSLLYTRQHVGPILGAQINELLSQIERFNGVTLFTTNQLGKLDEALNRRLALKLEFPMPNQEQRAAIWRRMMPKKAPLHKDVDFYKLAVVEVTGGYIKNAVLRAARMAAIEKVPDSKKKIRMEHLIKAITLETESMIEFDAARAENEGQYGHVVPDGQGGTIVRRGHAITRSKG